MDKAIIKEYENAVFWSYNGEPRILQEFKDKHKEEFKLISAMYRKRVGMKDTLNAMAMLGEPIFWFTLTFNNKKDSNTVEYKRKEAQEFLNKIAPIYLMVEEYGEDNGRYHIHGFLIFKYGKGFNDFREWHSRQKLEELTENKRKKKIRYLTKYAVKQVPRLRRSKQCCLLIKEYKKHSTIHRMNFKTTFENDLKQFIEENINLF